MKLMSIQKEAQEIAASICEIVGVDVVIVDDEMERVADTFRYPYNRIDIHTRSIVGSIVSSGRPQVVENKNYFQSCVECASRDRCQMQGLIGVPILLRGTTIGAMGMVLERNNAKRLLENVSLVLTFLSQMADLLSSKLSSRVDYSSLQRISSQWRDVLDTVDSGVVLVDEKNTVVVHNKRFSRYFQIPEQGCHGRLLAQLVDHPAVAEAIRRRSDVNHDQPIIVPLAQGAFYGSFHAKPMWQDGQYCGALFTFRDAGGLSSDGLLLYNGHGSRERLCGASAEGKLLQRRLHDPEKRDQPLLLQGVSEEYLLRLAISFHNSAGRTGRFMLINGRSFYDAMLEDPAAPGGISASILQAHQGTLCVSDVFALPVYVQRWLLGLLLGEEVIQEGFQTQFIFLAPQSPHTEEPLFRDPELARFLQPHRIDVPDPLGSTQRLQSLLDRSLAHYSACYGKSGLVVEPAAWELLLDFPRDQGIQRLYKAAEYLVRTCDGVITERAVSDLQRRLDAPAQSAKDFELQEIQRLLDAGVSCEQIANTLHISRATLYRRIKKHQLKTRKEVAL